MRTGRKGEMLVGGVPEAPAYKSDGLQHDMPSVRRKFLLTRTFVCYETFAKNYHSECGAIGYLRSNWLLRRSGKRCLAWLSRLGAVSGIATVRAASATAAAAPKLRNAAL
jgi:hypothetical protein